MIVLRVGRGCAFVEGVEAALASGYWSLGFRGVDLFVWGCVVGIELSEEWAQVLKVFSGEDFPALDEDAVRVVAGSFVSAGRGVDGAGVLLVAGVEQIRRDFAGDAEQAFVGSMQKFVLGEHGYLALTSKYLHRLAGACEDMATEIEYCKLMVIAALVALWIEFMVAVALAVWDPFALSSFLAAAYEIMEHIFGIVVTRLLVSAVRAQVIGIGLQVDDVVVGAGMPAPARPPRPHRRRPVAAGGRGRIVGVARSRSGWGEVSRLGDGPVDRPWRWWCWPATTDPDPVLVVVLGTGLLLPALVLGLGRGFGFGSGPKVGGPVPAVASTSRRPAPRPATPPPSVAAAGAGRKRGRGVAGAGVVSVWGWGVCRIGCCTRSRRCWITEMPAETATEAFYNPLHRSGSPGRM